LVDAVRFCLFDDIAQAHSGQNFPCYRIMLTLLKSCTYADSMASAKSLASDVIGKIR